MTTGDIWRSPDWAMELRCGRWQDVLGDVTTCDAVITDPPYSERTHSGMRIGPALTGSGNPYTRTGVGYATIPSGEVSGLCRLWSSRASGWFVAMTSHDLCPEYESSLSDRYVFSPVPFVELGKQPRLGGDGPASWTCWIMVARRHDAPKSGSLPGAYVPPPGCGWQADRIIKGGKPLGLMRAIVRDYSKPGDLIVDPYSGGGTTLLAAAIEGRRAIGAECDPETFRKAVARLSAGYTPRML